MPPRIRQILIIFASAAAGAGLAGCASTQTPPALSASAVAPTPRSDPAAPAGRIDAVAVQGGNLYGEMKDAGFVVPAVRPGLVDAAFHRANVAYSTRETPGTIVVDPAGHYLYYVEAGGRATRYGIGVGRDGTGIRQRK
ncbi:MAG: ErfK/YbiS/YcfS/YnhG family [Methylocystaceae bacterium]|nr:MAG: ErfK/YbiS/YcfS/YnhG family [Methylocystaceae bacterium]